MRKQKAQAFVQKAIEPGLRRVPRASVVVISAVKPDGLNICLDCWKRWMLADDRDLSASRMQLFGGDDLPERDADGNFIIGGYDTNPYDEQLKADNKIGEATGIMIEGLNKWQRWAIHKKCGVMAVWSYSKVDYMSTLIDAEKELEEKLRKNIATSTLF